MFCIIVNIFMWARGARFSVVVSMSTTIRGPAKLVFIVRRSFGVYMVVDFSTVG